MGFFSRAGRKVPDNIAGRVEKVCGGNKIPYIHQNRLFLRHFVETKCVTLETFYKKSTCDLAV
jgi:hypothetical protein